LATSENPKGPATAGNNYSLGILIQTLTPAEHRVYLQLLTSRSMTNIAEEFHLSVKTIDTHCTNILHKLRVRNRYALIIQHYESLIDIIKKPNSLSQ